MKLNVAWYSVPDFEAAKKFYRDVLGLPMSFEMPGWAEFAESREAASLGISGMPNANGRTGATVVFRVEDVEAARKSLRARGVKFEDTIQEIPGVVKIATFYDPSGNRLQLVQVLIAN